MTTFSQGELAEIRALSRKLGLVLEKGERIHPDCYELLRRHTKGVCTEVLAFDKRGSIFLNVRRPNNRSDPFAGRVALTGVTHGPLETETQALHRLLRTELQGLKICWMSRVMVDQIYDPDFSRGRYISFFRYALVQGRPRDPETKRFETPPWDQLIESSVQRILRWLRERSRLK